MGACLATCLRVAFDFIFSRVLKWYLDVVCDDEPRASPIVALVARLPYTICARVLVVAERVTAGILISINLGSQAVKEWVYRVVVEDNLVVVVKAQGVYGGAIGWERL